MRYTALLRTSLISFAALTTIGGLAGCSSKNGSEQTSFPFTGTTLSIVNDNSYMDVAVSQLPAPGAGRVVVEVTTSTLGQSTQTPDWNLADDVLNLGSPCGGSIIGYCEAGYSVKVPTGTKVTVNGKPVPVG